MAKKPVLLVDDEVDFREGLQQLLTAEGYEVFTAADGRDALDLLQTIPIPGVILLDLMMPRLTGQQFIKLAHADPALSAIPIVVISAAPVSVKSVAAMLPKPPDLDKLLEVVEHYCADRG